MQLARDAAWAIVGKLPKSASTYQEVGMKVLKNPEFHEFIMGIRPEKGQLPFYIGIHSFHTTALHYQPFAELIFVIDGSGYETINGMTHRMEPGTVSFVLPHHMHETKSDEGAMIRKYCCMFDMNMLFGSSHDAELNGWLYQVGSELPSFASFSGDEAAQLKSIFSSLMFEYANTNLQGRTNMIRNKLSEALIMFIRRVGSGDYPLSSLDHRDDSHALFWPVLHYVHVHYAEKLTLESIAGLFHISAPYVSRLFRENTGRSFLEYVHWLRINNAATMLITTDKLITDIAYETGFESLRTFSRVFREVKRKTPREYRNTKGLPDEVT